MSRAQKVRIIGGHWRGVTLDFPALDVVRPTPNRVREMLFNWLQFEITGASCLDLFAGSGALGFEAVSRGASHALLVDSDPRVCDHLRKQLVKLKTDQIAVLLADTYKYLKNEHPEAYDVVFLDPPFSDVQLDRLLQQIVDIGLVKNTGLVYVETALQQEQILIPNQWEWYKFKTVSSVSSGLLRRV